MPITSSAKKALRQSGRRKAQNLKNKEAYKKTVKEVRQLIKTKDKDKAKDLLAKAFQVLDKAAKKNVIKKNKADRLKSRIAKALAK